LCAGPVFPTSGGLDEKEITQMLKTAVETRTTVGIVLATIDANGIKVFSYGVASSALTLP
jgi:hypothetical protein